MSALAIGLSACAGRPGAASSNIPTAAVKEDDLELRVHMNGVVQTKQSTPLAAPPVAGGTLQIVKLPAPGTPVHAGDVVLEFDPAEQEHSLKEARSELAENEQQIEKAGADSSVQAAEDKTALLKARFAVRRAEFDVSKNEILSRIDGEKNTLALQEAKRALAQLEEDVHSHATANQATLAISRAKLAKARLQMEQANRNIERMRVASPVDGFVVVSQNYQASGGVFLAGMTEREFHVGDQVGPGEVIAEVIDLAELEIQSQVDEGDHGSLGLDQKVDVRLDALPGAAFSGVIATVGGVSAQGYFGDTERRTFEVTTRLESVDTRLRPGLSAQLIVHGPRVSRAHYVPRAAIFERMGSPCVFRREGQTFKAQPVAIRAFVDGLAIVPDLPKGALVALADPESSQGEKKSVAPGTPAGQGSP
jgi:multidrug resistance efflux pump